MSTNKIVLKEIENQVTIAVGSLSLVDAVDEDNKKLIDTTKAQLVGIVYGIRNLLDHLPNEPMTLEELENMQFQRAAQAAIDEEVIENGIRKNFHNYMENDLTWGL